MSRRLTGACGVMAAVAALLAPALAQACAVCGGGPDRMRTAFLISTGFLSLLPLALIFGGLWLLRRHARTVMRDEFLDRDEIAIRERAVRATTEAEAAATPLDAPGPARA